MTAAVYCTVPSAYHSCHDIEYSRTACVQTGTTEDPAGDQHAAWRARGFMYDRELSRFWPILLVDILVYVGVAASHGPVAAVTLKERQAELNFTFGQSSLIGLCATALATPAYVLVTGRITLELGSQMALFMGVAILVLMQILVSFAWSFESLFAFELLGTLANTAEQPGHVCLMSTYFGATSLPLATSAINAGYSCAGASMPIMAFILAHFGWRTVYQCSAGYLAISGVVVLSVLQVGPLPLGRAPKVSQTHPYTNALKAVISEWSFWALMIAGFCMMMYEGTVVSYLVVMLREDAGLELEVVAWLYSLQYTFAIVGKLTTGVVLRSRSPRFLAFVPVPLAFSLSHLLLLEIDLPALAAGESMATGLRITPNTSRLVAFSIIYGFSFGFTHSLLICQPVALFGRTMLPLVQNYLWAAVSGGFVIGKVAIGFARDYTGRFAETMLITFAASFTSALLISLLGMLPTVGHVVTDDIMTPHLGATQQCNKELV